MTASSRGSKAAAGLIRSSRHPRICSECKHSITRTLPSSSSSSSSYRRSYASAATASATPDVTDPITTAPAPSTSKDGDSITQSGLLLSRPPLLTRTLTPFEKSFFFYQKRLNERLSMPFSRYFYFKKDTPGDADWKLKARERNGQPARELGGYNAYGEEGWNDELLVGDRLSETESVVEALVRDSVVRAVEGKDGKAMEVVADGMKGGVHQADGADRPLGRITGADQEGDERSLERRLERTLYFCVKREGSGWGFPEGRLEGRENLLQAAERILVQTAGVNMNTWIVSHAPVGHNISHPRYEDSTLTKPGTRTFFMKARILAGQANLEKNLFGLSDFKWLTKEEVQKHVGQKYYSNVKNMLADR